MNAGDFVPIDTMAELAAEFGADAAAAPTTIAVRVNRDRPFLLCPVPRRSRTTGLASPNRSA